MEHLENSCGSLNQLNKTQPPQINLKINHKRPKTVIKTKNDRLVDGSIFRDPNASDHTLLGPLSKLDKEVKDLPAMLSDCTEQVSKPFRSAARTHVMSKQLINPLSVGSNNNGESSQQF